MVRLARTDIARLRSSVRLRFDAPSDTEMRTLLAAFERIHGRLPSTGQYNYLVRCARAQGSGTAALMERLYREYGTTENLLLAVEIHPVQLPSQISEDGTEVPLLKVV